MANNWPKWATEREIMDLFKVDASNLNIARLARQGRIERRLTSIARTQDRIWEYYVPQVRDYLTNRNGKGYYVSIRTAPTGEPELADRSRITQRIN